MRFSPSIAQLREADHIDHTFSAVSMFTSPFPQHSNPVIVFSGGFTNHFFQLLSR